MFLSLLLKIRIYPFLGDSSLDSSAAFQTTPLYSSSPGLFTRKSNHSTFWSKSREQWHNKRPERVKKRIQSQEFFYYLPSLNRILLPLYVQNPGGSKRNQKCSPTKNYSPTSDGIFCILYLKLSFSLMKSAVSENWVEMPFCFFTFIFFLVSFSFYFAVTIPSALMEKAFLFCIFSKQFLNFLTS